MHCVEKCGSPEHHAHPQGPAERPALGSLFDTLDREVNPRTSTGKCRGRIRNHFAALRDNSPERGCRLARATTDARSYGLHATPCLSETSCAVGEIARSVAVEDRVGLNIDPRAGKFRGKAGVLPLLADREGELVVGNQGAHGLGRLVDHV